MLNELKRVLVAPDLSLCIFEIVEVEEFVNKMYQRNGCEALLAARERVDERLLFFEVDDFYLDVGPAQRLLAQRDILELFYDPKIRIVRRSHVKIFLEFFYEIWMNFNSVEFFVLGRVC